MRTEIQPTSHRVHGTQHGLLAGKMMVPMVALMPTLTKMVAEAIKPYQDLVRLLPSVDWRWLLRSLAVTEVLTHPLDEPSLLEAPFDQHNLTLIPVFGQ